MWDCFLYAEDNEILKLKNRVCGDIITLSADNQMKNNYKNPQGELKTASSFQALIETKTSNGALD